MTKRTDKAILVVDDHTDSAEVLARLLKISGHDVATAATCKDALRAASERHFDLYIIDIGLPDGDGHELLRRLLEIKAVPAVALTAYGMEDDVARGIKAGFLDYLVKPVTASRLEEVIAAVMQANSNAPQNRSR